MTMVRTDSKYDRLSWKFEEARRLTALDDAKKSLYKRLNAVRARLAAEGGIPAYQVLSNKLLITLCERCPQSESELAEVTGMTRVRALAYGAELLAVTTCDTSPMQ